MIPRRIRLLNFLSYRECELDLAGLRLAVLSGRNGDGKSALLDAITWATWGKGRGRTDDQRIRLGADHALVDYEFEVSGARYRVVRKRTSGKASALDFSQMTDMGWKSVSGSTISETQEEIIRRVRMDYETFENSAFIAQGRADEFTKRTPAKRKEVFRKILGLEMFEELAKAATERRKDVERDSRAIRDQIEQAETRLERLPELAASIEGVRAALEEGAAAIAAIDAQVGGLRELAAVHSRLEKQVDEHRRRGAALHAEIGREREAQAETSAALAAAEALLTREAEVTARHRELLDLRGEEQSLAATMELVRGIERDISDARSRIAAERARLDAEAASLRRQVEERTRQAADLPVLREALARHDGEADAIVAVRTRAKEAAGRASALREQRAAADAAAQRCRAENKDLHVKREELLKAQRDGGTTQCPVCRQPLDPKDLDHVLDEYTAQKKALGERHTAATAEVERAGAAAAAAEEEAERLARDAEVREKQLARDRHESAARLGMAEEAERTLPALNGAFAAATASIEADSYAAEARERLARGEAALAETGYDAPRHAELRAAINRLGGVEAEMRDVAAARQRVDSLGERIADLAERIARLEVEEEGAMAALAEARAELETADDVAPRLREAESELAALRSRQGEFQVELGSTLREEETLRELQAQTEEAKSQASAYVEEAGIFTDLSQAFGKDGVQAMLISQSLPRLEFIANNMLERMTGGRITVRLRTTRANKAGAIQDTLDILIQDEAGTRDYEMYSGGEAFRVDFALRIALAKLLAERAGAELPTLIIDEGFGSQDAEGIDRLVDAITSISEEFRLILVVTHVEEMRSRFEQRIEVTKDPQKGSIARVA